MSPILPASVHVLYRPYALTILTRLYKQSSGQSSSPGCYTPAAPGGDTHRRPTDSELQLSSAEEFVGVSVLQTFIEELVSDMDDKLFNCILSDKHHVLHQLLPPERDCGYTPRPRKHELCLISKSRLDEQNFMYRLLFKDMY